MPRRKNVRDYSNDIRSLVMKHHSTGKSLGEIAKVLFMPKSSLQVIVASKGVKKSGRRGRKRKTTHRIERAILRKIMAN